MYILYCMFNVLLFTNSKICLKKPQNQNVYLLIKTFSFLIFQKTTMDLEAIVFKSY